MKTSLKDYMLYFGEFIKELETSISLKAKNGTLQTNYIVLSSSLFVCVSFLFRLK